MRKVLTVLALGAALATTSCRSGPSYLSNSVHDWHNQNYVEDPLVTGILTDIVPIYPIIGFLAGIPDWIILNPVQFWGADVWDGRGAGFYHENPPDPAKSIWFLD